MFTISGIGVIPKDAEITEHQVGQGLIINFSVITKDPYKDQRNHIKVAMHVPNQEIEKARETIKPMSVLQIRIGELTGNKTEKGTIFMQVRTKWAWVESLKGMPTGGRKPEPQ